MNNDVAFGSLLHVTIGIGRTGVAQLPDSLIKDRPYGNESWHLCSLMLALLFTCGCGERHNNSAVTDVQRTVSTATRPQVGSIDEDRTQSPVPELNDWADGSIDPEFVVIFEKTIKKGQTWREVIALLGSPTYSDQGTLNEGDGLHYYDSASWLFFDLHFEENVLISIYYHSGF